MLRWFITVFTLHFFLSVGVSAVGFSTPTESAQHRASVASLVLQHHEKAQLTALATVSELPSHTPADQVPDMPGHALADDLHDLPDELNPPMAVLRRPGPTYSPVQVDEAQSASHAPATPRKPPRTGLFA